MPGFPSSQRQACGEADERGRRAGVATQDVGEHAIPRAEELGMAEVALEARSNKAAAVSVMQSKSMLISGHSSAPTGTRSNLDRCAASTPFRIKKECCLD